MFKIYFSKAMQDAKDDDEQKESEGYLKRELINNCDGKLEIFNPSTHYNYETKHHKTEKEIIRYELENVRNSNLIIYTESGVKSIGASMELAVAYEHRIPILVLNKDNHAIHPWIEHVSNRVFETEDELVEYVTWYYF